MRTVKSADFDLSGLSFEEVEKYVTEHEGEFKQSSSGQKSSKREIIFKIIKNFGPLSERKYAPIFTLIDWGGYLRYDIRHWDEGLTSPRKGTSFTEAELQIIVEKAKTINIESLGKVVTSHYNIGKAKATIYENICRLSESKVSGTIWHKEVNLVNWGYGTKIDMRKWTEGYEKCSKGISITQEEFDTFIQIAKKEL